MLKFASLFTVCLLLFSCNKDVELKGVKDFKYVGSHAPGRLTYTETPPVGGIHNQVWQNCGIYDTQIALENAVHSLEHGAVWITYQPDLPAQEVQKLRDYAVNQTYMLVSPYQYGALETPISVVAWNHSLSLNSASDPQIAAFIKKYRNSPDLIEFGAACTGGTGTPN
jgi:hypothetical protein